MSVKPILKVESNVNTETPSILQSEFKSIHLVRRPTFISVATV